MHKITKKYLVEQIARQEKIPAYKARSIFDLFCHSIIQHTSKGKRIELRGFGVFSSVLRKQKIGRNPKKAKDPIVIPQRHMLKFTPAIRVKKLFENKKINRE